MDEKTLRERDVELRVWHAFDDEPREILDDLTRRREQQRRTMTERERTERWPCG